MAPFNWFGERFECLKHAEKEHECELVAESCGEIPDSLTQ